MTQKPFTLPVIDQQIDDYRKEIEARNRDLDNPRPHGFYRLPLFGMATYYTERLGIDDLRSTFEDLKAQTSWRQENVTIQGRTFPQPRLIAWHGDPGAGYAYSGLALEPAPWSPVLTMLRDRVTRVVNDLLADEGLPPTEFNSALLNYYRHGQDSIGYHSDNERELGREPIIASLSLGGSRELRFKRRSQGGFGPAIPVMLHHGSLLVMAGSTQRNWVHGIEKTKSPCEPRLNITFRRIVPQASRR